MRRFNVTGICVPAKHYMVDIRKKLIKIKTMIDQGLYFTINRARQYGKTTTLYAIRNMIKDEYLVIQMSFEGVGSALFESEKAFCKTFLEMIEESFEIAGTDEEYTKAWNNPEITDLKLLNKHIKKMCKLANKKIVLLIDEVDKSSDNQIFLHFLGMLRDKYMLRETGDDYTFYSVILAGVYDIKNIKLKMVSEGVITINGAEERKFNSPWNIAAKFDVDMSFSTEEIATMLYEYKQDVHVDMDIEKISKEIYIYTSGYPFLVSRICQEIEEHQNRNWTIEGIREAVKEILIEKNTLFDDIGKNLENNSELNQFMYDILILGKEKNFETTNPNVDLALTFGFIKNRNGKVAIDNRIFEIKITNYFISKNMDNQRTTKISGVLSEDIILDGRFNMELALRKFAEHYKDLYANDSQIPFLEKNGRMLFLTYIRPLLNGRGFYHIESETNNERRMDIVINYGREEFILELKIWYGEKSHEEAYLQLENYLNAKGASKGYLLTFDFRKHKESRYEEIVYKNKEIVDVIV